MNEKRMGDDGDGDGTGDDQEGDLQNDDIMNLFGVNTRSKGFKGCFNYIKLIFIILKILL